MNYWRLTITRYTEWEQFTISVNHWLQQFPFTFVPLPPQEIWCSYPWSSNENTLGHIGSFSWFLYSNFLIIIKIDPYLLLYILAYGDICFNSIYHLRVQKSATKYNCHHQQFSSLSKRVDCTKNSLSTTSSLPLNIATAAHCLHVMSCVASCDTSSSVSTTCHDHDYLCH